LIPPFPGSNPGAAPSAVSAPSFPCVGERTTFDDALIDELAGAGTAYVPLFPLTGFTPLWSAALSIETTPMF